MIPITGTTSLLGLRITDATQSSQVDTIRNSVQHSRAIDSFLSQVKDIETVDQFVDNYEVYSFVMKAFDLEDQIFGKAMIKAALKSNIEDDEALINRLTDPRIKDLYDAMGFGEDGEGNINTILSSWRNRMVDRYVDRIFVNGQAEQNNTVGAALEFRRRAAEIDGPFDVLKNVDTANFMRKVLGLPDQMVQLDIDRQAAILEEKYDLSKLKDPEEVERLIQKFVIISDAQDGTNVATNPVVMMMQGATGIGSGQFTPITFDITAVDLSSFRVYR
jgi:hypothetical protein